MPVSEATAKAGETPRPFEDRHRIYLAKTFRAVAYGALSGFLFLYLEQQVGLDPTASLVITSLTLVGAAAWSLLGIGPVERRLGRRRSAVLFAALFTLSGALLYLSAYLPVVIFGLLLGGVAAHSADNGPLASIDQAVLPSTLRRRERTEGFAWYNLIANFASAGGAALLLVPGSVEARDVPFLPPAPHPWIGLIYLLLAAATLGSYLGLSPRVELASTERPEQAEPLRPETRQHVRALAALFGLDAFAGGLIINPVIAAFFVLAWHQSGSGIGLVLSAAGTVSGVSLLLASRLANRFGLLPTMVFTHLPSNVLLMLVPLMPTFPLAIGLYLARMSLSQMDVPTRQAYAMNMVPRRERARVSGTLSGARGVPQSVGPFASSALLGALGSVASAFYLGGALKVVYDLLLWRRFRSVEVPGAMGLPAAPPSAPDEGGRGR